MTDFFWVKGASKPSNEINIYRFKTVLYDIVSTPTPYVTEIGKPSLIGTFIIPRNIYFNIPP